MSRRAVILLILAMAALLPASAFAQVEQPCPSGTVPITGPSWQTYNATTGQFRQNGCVNPSNGNMLIQIPTINQVQWAGPGATPTIDQAVAACGSSPCFVYISTTYTGPESANLFTTSIGYRVYTGINNVTIVDLRQNPATPQAPDAPIYSIEYGGRMTGALNRASFNYWAASPEDSSAGLQGSNWLSGALPSAGDQFGIIATLNTHDTVTVGGSTVQVLGLDAEVNANATSSDAPLPTVFGIGAGAHITRADATQNITTMGAFKGFGCGNISTATITNCYVVWAQVPGGGSSQAYSIRSDGSFILGDAANFDVYDTGGTPSTFFSTNNGAILFKKDLRGSSTVSLGDAGGEWGGFYQIETSSPVGRAGDTVCGAVSATHDFRCSYNNDTPIPMSRTVARGTATMTTAAITAGNCGATVTVAATGVATTDAITWAFNTAPAGSNAGLVAWPTANNVNFAYCPGIAETPAAKTINWTVIR